MINWANFLSQMFNGLVLGALLALISSGLTIIYGTLGVLNLAHGAMFMLGGYAGYVAYTFTESFIIAVIAGSVFLMGVGLAMERLIIRHFYGRPHEDQLLVTFGLSICFSGPTGVTNSTRKAPTQSLICPLRNGDAT